MSTSNIQSTIFGEPSGESVSIDTEGRTIRPAMHILTVLADETRMRFDASGIHVAHADPANVGLLKFHAHPDAFDDYHVDADDAVTVGVHLTRLRKKLRSARMGKRTSDPVSVEFDESRTLIELEREYDRTTVTQTDEVLNLDPDSIRSKPEPPSMDLPWGATVDVDAFHDVAKTIDQSSDHIDVIGRDGRLLLAGDSAEATGEYATVADFGPVDDLDGEAGDDVLSKLSLDYVLDIAKALKKGKATDLQLRWGQEFPVMLDFERVADETTLYDGRFMVAPRIQSDD